MFSEQGSGALHPREFLAKVSCPVEILINRWRGLLESRRHRNGLVSCLQQLDRCLVGRVLPLLAVLTAAAQHVGGKGEHSAERDTSKSCPRAQAVRLDDNRDGSGYGHPLSLGCIRKPPATCPLVAIASGRSHEERRQQAAPAVAGSLREEAMSRENAIAYMNRVVQMLNEENVEPRDRALVLASLAQTEATLDVADRIQAGLALDVTGVDALDGFSNSALALSAQIRKLLGNM